MDISFLLRGFLIGLSIAAVVGPLSILCIQRTLHHGFRYGLVSGVGVAVADAVYGSIAAFGLTIITSFLLSQQLWIRLIGGAFLIYLGVKSILSKPAKKAAETKGIAGFWGAPLSTFLLTMTNPTTILSFAAIFAGLGVVGGTQITTALLVVAGVFLGSMLWWCVLISIVSLLRKRFTPNWLIWVNRASGLVIAAFGVVALVSLWR